MKSCLIKTYIAQLNRLADMHWCHHIQARDLIVKLAACTSFASLRAIMRENTNVNEPLCALNRHLNAWNEDLQLLEQAYQRASKVLQNTSFAPQCYPLKELLECMMADEWFLFQAPLGLLNTINDVGFEAIVNYLGSLPPKRHPHYKNNFPDIMDADYQACCQLLAYLAADYNETRAVWNHANGLLQDGLQIFIVLHQQEVAAADEVGCIFC